MDMIVGQQGQNSTKTLNGKLRILFVTAAVAFFGLTQAATADSYKLNPGDQVEISVWNEENLQKTITVLPDGMISFPLVGHLQAAVKARPKSKPPSPLNSILISPTPRSMSPSPVPEATLYLLSAKF
jgi:hypothetical protein